MKIYHAQVNHLENPVGFRMERTVFSWKIKEAKGKQQSYARIRVSSDEAMEHLLFDSGEDTKASSLCYPVKLELEPRTRYYWTVEAGSDAGEKAVSEVQFFETGKREEAWYQQIRCFLPLLVWTGMTVTEAVGYSPAAVAGGVESGARAAGPAVAPTVPAGAGA